MVPKFGQITEWFRNRKQQKILTKIIDNIKPDLIIGQRYGIRSAVLEGYKKRIPTTALIIAYDNLYSCKEKNFESRSHEIKKYSRNVRDIFEYPFRKNLAKQNREAINKADVIIVQSKFMAETVEKLYGISPQIIYPFVKLSECKAEKWNPKYITFIRPTVYKGVEVFLKIAKNLKNRKFLCVGKASKIYEKKLKESSFLGRITSKRNRTDTFPSPNSLEDCLIQVFSLYILNEIPQQMSHHVLRIAVPTIIMCKGLPFLTDTGNEILFIDAINQGIFFHLHSLLTQRKAEGREFASVPLKRHVRSSISSSVSQVPFFGPEVHSVSFSDWRFPS